MVVSEYLSNYRYKNTDDLFDSGKWSQVDFIETDGSKIPRYINEFWTSKQRQASSIHEISYRACFKPQLPRFFIDLLTEKGDTVYDPFSGRGTTVIEAGLNGRKIISNDINPLSRILSMPRFSIPKLIEIEERLRAVKIKEVIESQVDLSMFYHPDTFNEILSLRRHLKTKIEEASDDHIDRWIQMIATNRLSGHSPGFFSVYTLPPNQAVSPEAQIKINSNRKQKPEYRDIKNLIMDKSASILRNITKAEKQSLNEAGESAMFLANDARNTPEIDDGTVKLTVTSPPFLDVVQYSKDNWLRCWFNGIAEKEIDKKITMSKTVEQWALVMTDVLRELFRITRTGGWVAFEVGEVRNATVRLDEVIVPLGIRAGFKCEGILINQQEFTKTSNIWGISNNSSGTNTNRIVLFHKAWE